MPLDSVPWFVGGGAQHSPEVARLLAFAATNGAEGVVLPGNLKVVATGTPSAQVQVRPGAGVILNRAVGGDLQTYMARNPTATTVSVAATSSSGARSDLIVLQVEDPFMSGEPWQDPADVTVGPYVFVRVIPNVPNTTTRLQDVSGYEGRSAITLARIDIPVSTATITNAMITDLRSVANPRETTVVAANLGTVTGTMDSTAYQAFPPYQPTLAVPDWATYARIDVTISQVQAAGNSNGFVNLSARDTSGTTVIGASDTMAYNVDTAGSSVRFTHLASIYVNISAYAGQNFKPYVHFQKQTSNQNSLTYDQYSQMVYRVTFYEKTV